MHMPTLTESISSESRRVNEARDKFFPGWYLYHHGLGTVKPKYRVVCEDWDEYLLARKVKPDNIRAKIIYKPRRTAAKLN